MDYIIRYKTDRKTKAIKAEIFQGDTKVYGTVWNNTKAGALFYALNWLNHPDTPKAHSITEE